MADFIDEAVDSLAPIPGLFIQLEENPQDLDLLNAVFRPVHSLKGNAAYFGLVKIKVLAHDMESVLDRLRKERLLVSKHIIDCLLAGVDEINAILDTTRAEGVEIVDGERFDLVR